MTFQLIGGPRDGDVVTITDDQARELRTAGRPLEVSTPRGTVVAYTLDPVRALAYAEPGTEGPLAIAAAGRWDRDRGAWQFDQEAEPPPLQLAEAALAFVGWFCLTALLGLGLVGAGGLLWLLWEAFKAGADVVAGGGATFALILCLGGGLAGTIAAWRNPATVRTWKDNR